MTLSDPRQEDLLPQMRENRRLLIFFHENAGNLGLRLDYFNLMYHKGNCDILAVAYRGYSDSSGFPSEQGLKNDAIAKSSQILTPDSQQTRPVLTQIPF